MKAAQLVSSGRVAVNDVPPPTPADGYLVVRTEILGVCGTDLKIVKGTVPVALPRTLGHEMIGRVEEGDDNRLPVGTRVLADPAIACGTCRPCIALRPNLCRFGGLMGREEDGVFADLALVPAVSLLPVPETIEDTEAGLLQVLGTCVHALRGVEVFPGDVAVVVGLGVAGQLMVQLLAASGATVLGVTRSAEKRALAERYGAAATCPPDAAAELVREHTDDLGADIVVEAVGTEATVATSIELAGPGADVVVFGTVTGGSEGLPYYQLYFKELRLWNPRAAVLSDYARAIELVASGTLSVGEIVTHRVPLDDFDRALSLAAEPGSLKVLIESG